MARSSRPVWEGHLRLSLVTCPIAVFKATAEGQGVHFHLLHPQSHNRVKQAWRDPSLPDGEQDVPRNELIHGYEVEKGKYVIIDDEDIKSVRLESTKTIQIERFVDAGSIDRLYWDTPYYVAPTGKADLTEPFAVIRDAMAQAGKVALGRVVMTGRERIVAIEVRGKGMVMTTMHAQDEVRSDAEIFGGIAEVKPDRQMVEIAEAIIAKQEGPFDPTAFHDRYAEAVRALVAEKAKGHVIEDAGQPAPESNVIDLMEALRRSLRGGQGDKPGEQAAAHAPAGKPAADPPARKAAAKKPATKKPAPEPQPEPAPKRRATGRTR